MTRDEAMSKLQEIMQETFNLQPDQINENLNFRNDLGADSISMMEFVLELENIFDIEVEDADMEKIQTVGEALDYITSK